MNETKFNLLDEPWIRVIDSECKITEVSLIDAIINSHKYVSLRGEIPLQDIVVLRLILAVLHTVFSRVDKNSTDYPIEDEQDALDRWIEIWENNSIPEQPIRDYFKEWYDRFWLFHPERPFGQVAQLKEGTKSNSEKLNGAIAQSGNKKRFFSMIYGKERTELTYAQAARWLLYLNSFDDSSIKPKGKAEDGGKLPSAKQGWLARFGIVHFTGDNLFETLMLNLVMINDGVIQNNQKPIWERTADTCKERVEIAIPDNLAELYTVQSRRILLERNGDKITGYNQIVGDIIKDGIAFKEPMTSWSYHEKNKEFILKKHDPSKQIWREFSALYNQSNNTKKAGVILWYQTYLTQVLDSSKFIRTSALSIVTDDNPNSRLTKDFYYDVIDMHSNLLTEVGENWRNNVQDEIQKCEELANCISRFAEELNIASGGSNNDTNDIRDIAKKQFYYRVDVPFRNWLKNIDPEDFVNEQAIIDNWHKMIKNITLNYADELVKQVSDIAFVGHIINKDNKTLIYSAPNAMNKLKAQLNKIYNLIKKEGDKNE